jgi:methionyl-tRNA formyltransferase
MDNIVIATIKSWNIENAKRFSESCRDYNVFIITDKDKLQAVHELNPRYIFFPHWSWKIPKEIYEKFECVAFHMADLPYGRGGSPLQNLIIRKIYQTKISAFRVDDGIDTGPIYQKMDFDISKGSADELYREASRLIFKYMIPSLIKYPRIPIPQEGEVLEFKRRTSAYSSIESSFSNGNNGVTFIYDHIRMLDAEGYPRSNTLLGFWNNKKYGWDNARVYFSDAHLEGDKVTGRFEIVRE